MTDLDLTAVEELAQRLRDAGLSASADPAEVNTPGVWVTLDTLAPVTVDDSWELVCACFLVCGDLPYPQAYASLQELYTSLAAAGVTPDGPVTHQGLVLPDSPTVLPALRVPVNLYT